MHNIIATDQAVHLCCLRERCTAPERTSQIFHENVIKIELSLLIVAIILNAIHQFPKQIRIQYLLSEHEELITDRIIWSLSGRRAWLPLGKP